MNDMEERLNRLVNDAVDSELGGHREPPPFAAPPHHKARPATALAAWRTPVLAAAIFGVIVTRTVIAVTRAHPPARSLAPVAPATSPVSPAPVRPAPSTAVFGSQAAGAIRDAGQAGRFIWALGTTGIARSDDGGTTWTIDALPAPIVAAKVQSIAATADGTLYLAALKASTLVVYRQVTGAGLWSGVDLTPTWPARTNLTGPPTSTILTPGPGNLLTAVLGLSVGMTTSAESVFISTDDSTTFTQYPNGLTETITGVAFTSATNGLAIQGPNRAEVSRTTDGGRTWTNVTVAAPPSGSTASYGQPIIDGSTVTIPTIVQDSNFTAHISYYRSTDGGITFPSTTGQPLTISSADNQTGLSLAAVGDTRWVLVESSRKLYVSNDDGATWTTILSPSLPAGGTLSLGNSDQATLTTETGSCAGYKRDCTSQIHLYVTTDGGHRWRQR